MVDIQKTACWFVYMIRTEDSALYTGITTDIDRRFKEHLDSFNGLSTKGAKYFRSREPVEIVYREQCLSRSEASSREYQIKKMNARDKRALVEPNLEKVVC